MSQFVQQGEDGVVRCWWPGADDEYVNYHDHEWGRPVVDDIRLFEKVCLEGFQAGLSWITILRKRENFRAAFAGFDFETVSEFGEADVERLLGDAGIVRHQGKIRSTINNAARAIELVEEAGSLAAWFWSWEPEPQEGEPDGDWPIPSITPTSKAIAKALKKKGWTFVGPTTVYAFMQAMGMVNDHLPGCEAGEECDRERSALQRPR